MRERLYLTLFALIALAGFALSITPVISSFSISPKYVNDSTASPTLSISATDANSMQFSCDGITFSALEAYAAQKTNFNIKTGEGCNASDGNKTIRVKLESIDGNSATATDWAYLDNAVPAITVILPSSSTTVNSNWLVFDVNDAVGVNSATISIKVGGSAATLAGTGCTALGTNYHCDYNVNSIDRNGTYNITIDASDSAGNAAVQAGISGLVYEDNVSPGQVALDTATAGNATVTLTWTLTEPFDMNKYHVYKSTHSGFDTNSQTLIATVNAGTKTYADSNVSNGTTYYYKVSALDHSLNEGIDSAEKSAAPADTSTPSGSISLPDYSSSTTPAITLSYTGTPVPTLMRFSCNNDSSWDSSTAYSSSYSSFNVNSGNDCNSSDGLKTVFVQFSSGNGSWSTAVSDTVTLDTNKPFVTAQVSVSGTSAEITFAGSDAGGSGVKGYYSRLDALNWAYTAGTSRSISSLSSGLHSIEIIAVDYADLNSTAITKSFEIGSTSPPPAEPQPSTDTTKPAVKIEEPKDNSIVYGTVKLKARASDNKGIKKVTFYAGSKVIGNAVKEGEFYVLDWKTSDLNETKYVITASAYDLSNNSSMDIVSVFVSKTKPTTGSDANLSREFESLKESLEEFKNESFGLSLSSATQGLQARLSAMLGNAEKAIEDSNNTAMLESIEKAKTMLSELSKSFSTTILKSTKTNFDFSKTGEFLEKSGLVFNSQDLSKTIKLTENSRPERTIRAIKVNDSNSSYYIVKVSVKFQNDSNMLKKFKIIEAIPKEFAENASLLKSNAKITALSEDPLIALEANAQAWSEVQVSYMLGEKFTDANKALLFASEETAKKFSLPPIIAESTASIKTQEQAGIGSLAIIVAVLVIVVLAVILFFASRRKPEAGNWAKPAKIPEKHFEGFPKRKFQKQNGNNSSHLSGLRDKGRIEGWD